MTRRFLMFCEAPGDFAMASALADRVLAERGPDWLRELLEHRPLAEHREWVGVDATAPFVAWVHLRSVRESLGVRPSLGRFDGAAAGRMALAARDALAIARHLAARDGVDGTWLVKDHDRVDIRAGLDQARAEVVAYFAEHPIVIGVPKHEMEAWLLHGFEPDSEQERPSSPTRDESSASIPSHTHTGSTRSTTTTRGA